MLSFEENISLIKVALNSNLDFLKSNIFYSNAYDKLIFSPVCSKMLQNGVRAYWAFKIVNSYFINEI